MERKIIRLESEIDGIHRKEMVNRLAKPKNGHAAKAKTNGKSHSKKHH